MEERRLKRGKREERIRGGQSRGKVNTEWGKKREDRYRLGKEQQGKFEFRKTVTLKISTNRI